MRLRKRAKGQAYEAFWSSLSSLQKQSILIAGSLSFLILFDIYGSAVILADLAPVLNSKITLVQRVQMLFFLGLTLLVPVAGWAASRAPLRWLTATAMAIFAGSGAAIVALPMLEVYIGARFLQGMAAGLVLPLALSIINGSFETEKKGRAMGLWGLTALMAPLLAPPLAGWISEQVGPVGHFAVVAAGAVAIGALCLSILPTAITSHQRGSKRFDWQGYFLLGSALCVLVAATTPLLEKHLAMWVVGCGMGTIVLFSFYIKHAKKSPQPLISLDLFRYRDFSVGLGVTMGRSFLIVGSTLALPLFLKESLSLDTGTIGVLFFVSALLLALLTPVIGTLIDRGCPLGLASFGFIVFGIASGGFMLLPTFPSLWLAGTLLLVRAVAIAFITGPTMAGTLSVLPALYNYEASSTFNLAQRIGGTLGAASVSVFLGWVESHSLLALFALFAGISGLGTLTLWGTHHRLSRRKSKG